MMFRIFLFATAIFFLNSCKKDPSTDPIKSVIKLSYDTLKPSNYFPVYPGSYWKYKDSKGVISEFSTEPEYQLSYYVNPFATNMFSDTFYVPLYKGSLFGVHGDYEIWGSSTKWHSSSPVRSPLTTVVTDTLPIGSSWRTYYYRGTEKIREIQAKDTSITIDGKVYYPTISVNDYTGSTSFPLDKTTFTRKYYTKGIGLVLTEYYKSGVKDTHTVQLIDYFINK